MSSDPIVIAHVTGPGPRSEMAPTPQWGVLKGYFKGCSSGAAAMPTRASSKGRGSARKAAEDERGRTARPAADNARSGKLRACDWPQGQRQRQLDSISPQRAKDARPRVALRAQQGHRATPQGLKGAGHGEDAQGVQQSLSLLKRGDSTATKAPKFGSEPC